MACVYIVYDLVFGHFFDQIYFKHYFKPKIKMEYFLKS
jgi:hypothetical protein